jgi:hypothetical protein
LGKRKRCAFRVQRATLAARGRPDHARSRVISLGTWIAPSAIHHGQHLLRPVPAGGILGARSHGSALPPSPAATLAELISYVYDAFHVPLRQDLRLLEHLTESAALSQHPAARAMHTLACRFADDARLHMSREENEIFPRILSGQGPRCANIVAALHVDNHQSHERGRGLRRLARCAQRRWVHRRPTARPRPSTPT